MGPPSSRRSLTRSTIQLGTASWAETLALMSRTKPSISSTSTWGRLRFCSSSLADHAGQLHCSHHVWPFAAKIGAQIPNSLLAAASDPHGKTHLFDIAFGLQK